MKTGICITEKNRREIMDRESNKSGVYFQSVVTDGNMESRLTFPCGGEVDICLSVGKVSADSEQE